MHTLTTPRLSLRQWRAADHEPFAALNADPAVMEFMPGRLARAASDAFAEWAAADLEARGWGVWAAPAARSHTAPPRPLPADALRLASVTRARSKPLHRRARCDNIRAAASFVRRARCWNSNETAQSVD